MNFFLLIDFLLRKAKMAILKAKSAIICRWKSQPPVGEKFSPFFFNSSRLKELIGKVYTKGYLNRIL